MVLDDQHQIKEVWLRAASSIRFVFSQKILYNHLVHAEIHHTTLCAFCKEHAHVCSDWNCFNDNDHCIDRTNGIQLLDSRVKIVLRLGLSSLSSLNDIFIMANIFLYHLGHSHITT